MKRLIYIAILLNLSLIATAQVYPQPSYKYGNEFQRGHWDSTLHIPEIPDTLSHDIQDTSAEVRVIGDSIWFTPGGGRPWKNLSRASAGGLVPGDTAYFHAYYATKDSAQYWATQAVISGNFLGHKVAYVDTLGNDISAILGDKNHPFATIQAAITAVGSNASIYVNPGIYDSVSIASTIGIKIIGTQAATYNPVLRQWNNDGVLIRGRSRDTAASYCSFINLAFTIKNGIESDNLTIHQSPNVLVDGCNFAGHSCISPYHNLLIEDGSSFPVVRNIQCYYSSHAIALKVIGGYLDGAYMYGHLYDNVIVKSDNQWSGADSAVLHTLISNVRINSPATDSSQAGIIIQQYSTGASSTRSTQISHCYVNNVEIGYWVDAVDSSGVYSASFSDCTSDTTLYDGFENLKGMGINYAACIAVTPGNWGFDNQGAFNSMMLDPTDRVISPAINPTYNVLPLFTIGSYGIKNGNILFIDSNQGLAGDSTYTHSFARAPFHIVSGYVDEAVTNPAGAIGGQSNLLIQATDGGKHISHGAAISFAGPTAADGSVPSDFARIWGGSDGATGSQRGEMDFQVKGLNSSGLWTWKKALQARDTGLLESAYPFWFTGGNLTYNFNGITSVQQLTDTLTATANGQGLVGLYINPVFVPGSFTGGYKAAIVVNGAILPYADNTWGLGSSSINWSSVNSRIYTSDAALLVSTTTAANITLAANNIIGFDMINSNRHSLFQNGGTYTDNGFQIQSGGDIGWDTDSSRSFGSSSFRASNIYTALPASSSPSNYWAVIENLTTHRLETMAFPAGGGGTDTSKIPTRYTLDSALAQTDTVHLLNGSGSDTMSAIIGHDSAVIYSLAAAGTVSLTPNNTTRQMLITGLAPINDGSGYTWAEPWTSKMKSLQLPWGMLADTSTTGVIKLLPDSSKLLPRGDTNQMNGYITPTQLATAVAGAGGGVSGFNVTFKYGTGNSALPFLNTDSIYVNTGFIGKNVMVYVKAGTFASFLVDSLTQAQTSLIDSTPYFRYNKTLGKFTFCNFGYINGFVNGKFTVNIFGGAQGYPAAQDTGIVAGPTLTLTPTSLSGYSTNEGVASTAQTFTISGTSLTANAVLTPPIGYQISPNGTTYYSIYSVAESGGTLTGQPVTIYTRLDTTVAGSYSGNLTATSTGATAQDLAMSGTVNTPTITLSASSITGMTDTAGAVGTPAIFTAAGTHLTGNITVTAPTNFLVSTDDATFSGSVTLTQSGGTVSTTHVYVQIASTATAGSIGPVNVTATSSGASTQNVAVSGTVYSGGGVGMDSIRVQFTDSTGDIAQTGFKNIEGDIINAGGNISVTGGNSNSITVTATKANWSATNGSNMSPTTTPGFNTCSYSAFSINTTNVLFPYATNAVSGLWFNSVSGLPSGDGGSIAAQIEISGLVAGHTYSLSITGASSVNLFNSIEANQTSNYYAGSSLSSIKTGANNSVPLCDQGAGTPTNSTVMGLFNAANSNQLTADSNGDLFIWIIAENAGSVAGVSAFVLTQTD